MVKYDYDWLIRQYIQEFDNNMDDDIVTALKEFINSNKSRQIYYTLAILFFYKKPLWYIDIVAKYQVKKAIRNTALAPFRNIIVRKILTDAKAKALQSLDYCAYDWRKYHRHEKSSNSIFASIKQKLSALLRC